MSHQKLNVFRLKFCSKDIQKKYFPLQCQLARETKLPLFLHCRNAFDDFIDILQREIVDYSGDHTLRGVVHTFDGTLKDAETLVGFGFYLGINGCSLKTQQQLDVVRHLPLDRLLIETDAPWCEIRPSHASYKYLTTFPQHLTKKEKWMSGCQIKSRNEPINIHQVFEVLCSIRTESADDIMHILYNNTKTCFNMSFEL